MGAVTSSWSIPDKETKQKLLETFKARVLREPLLSPIAHVTRQVDLQETIKKGKRSTYLTYGTTMQPSIFIVGESVSTIEHYFVLVDNIFYSAHNILEAVDVCLKLV